MKLRFELTDNWSKFNSYLPSGDSSYISRTSIEAGHYNFYLSGYGLYSWYASAVFMFNIQMPAYYGDYTPSTPATFHYHISRGSGRRIIVQGHGNRPATVPSAGWHECNVADVSLGEFTLNIVADYDYWDDLTSEANVVFSGKQSANAAYLEVTLKLLPPVLKRPLGGYVDTDKPIDVEWTAPVHQVQARVSFYQDGVQVHSITLGSTARTYTVPAGTFDRTKSLQWTAQIADIDGIWSDNAEMVLLTTAPADPEKPDLIRPVGLILDTATEIAFRWAYRSGDGSAQASAVMELSSDRGQTWASYSVGSASEYTASSGALSPGTYLWRVRTYNINGIQSPISDTAEFYIYGRPNAPTITEITTDTAKPTVYWGSSDQTAYEIEISHNGEAVYYRYVAGNEREHTPDEFFDDERYTVRLRVINGYGLISDWTEAAMLISTDKPAAPSIFAAESRDCNRIIVNADGDDIAYILLYRKRIDKPHADGHFDDTKTVVIARVQTHSLTYDDYSAASGARYQYYARAVTSGDTFNDSNRVIGVHHITGTMLSLAAKPGEDMVSVRFNVGAPVKRRNNLALEGGAIHYVGRTLPVYEYAQFTTSRWTLEAMFETGEQLDAFKRLIQRRGIILYRDQYGRKMYIGILGNTLTPDTVGVAFNLPFEEVDYHE